MCIKSIPVPCFTVYPDMDTLLMAMDKEEVFVGLVDHLHLLFYSDDVTDMELEQVGKIQQVFINIQQID